MLILCVPLYGPVRNTGQNGMKKKLIVILIFAILGVIFLAAFVNSDSPVRNKKYDKQVPGEEEKSPGSPECGGVERWAVKVFTDALASKIDWTPKPTTIAHLVSIQTPTPDPNMARYQPVEDSTYVVTCNITRKKDESDNDYHLVLSDGINTLIGEVPDPKCSSVAVSPKVAKFTIARNWVFKNIGMGNVYTVNLPPVVVTGVAFIDPPHGQYGAAPNNLELHSIIDIHFVSETGINDPGSGDVKIEFFPNPFTEETTLQSDIELRNATLVIYNSSGQPVKTEERICGSTYTLSRNKLPAGIYFFRLVQDNKIIRESKVVIGK
jgi:hypothetical protein